VVIDPLAGAIVGSVHEHVKTKRRAVRTAGRDQTQVRQFDA